MENNKNQTIINDNNKSISLSDIMRVIKKNWILIIIVTAIVFIFGTSYTYGIAKPKYNPRIPPSTHNFSRDAVYRGHEVKINTI